MILQKCLGLSRTFNLVCQITKVSKHREVCLLTLQETTQISSSFMRRFSVNSNQISLASNKQSMDMDNDAQLKLFKLEIYQLRESGKRAPNPESMTKSDWENILPLKSKSARIRYYSHLSLLKVKKENSLMKKQATRQAYVDYKKHQALEVPQRGHDQQINYSLGKTTFFLRIRESTMNVWRNNKLARAMQFGDKLIFDCSYDQYMDRREAQNAAKQLMMSFGFNRKHKQPFDLHFCNANFNCDTMRYLERFIPTMRNKEFPMNIHEGSYLDVFPKEKLVYLTPHCNNDLVEYDPDSIYIIGAMVDKRDKSPFSLGKAKELGLRMARLPLDKYLRWAGGSGKSLTLDQMTQIMLDFQLTRNWEYALRHVPKRKLFDVGAPPRIFVKK